MNGSPPSDAVISDARVDQIVEELNASGRGLDCLESWAAESSGRADRVIEGPDVAYVRLAGRAEGGGPVIIAYFEGAWERATNRAPTTSDLEDARARKVSRVATVGLLAQRSATDALGQAVPRSQSDQTEPSGRVRDLGNREGGLHPPPRVPLARSA